MKKGEVFFHSNFRFNDGESAPKLLVLLNVPRNKSESYLFCKTTSNQKKKIFQVGCQADKSTFYIPKDTDFFVMNTWLELYYIAPMDAVTVIADSFSKLLISKGMLSDLTIRQIMNCIKRIKLIEVKYKEMILGS